MKLHEEVGRGPRTSRLDLGGNADQGPDPEYFCAARLLTLSVDNFSILRNVVVHKTTYKRDIQ